MSLATRLTEVENIRWRLQIFSGFRLRDPQGIEFRSKSKRLIALLTLLALQKDFAFDRHTLAQAIYWDAEDTREDRLTVLLSRTTKKLQANGISFLKITSDSVWLDPNLVEIDSGVAREIINQISSTAEQGKPIKHQFDSLGDLIAPLDFVTATPHHEQALLSFKQSFLHQIQSKLVPAVGWQYGVTISSIIDSLALEDPLSPSACAQLMAIYAGVGDTASVHKVFARHEDAVSEYFGEPVSKTTEEAYALALESEPYIGMSPIVESEPPNPSVSFGIELFTKNIEAAVSDARRGDIIYIVGSTGAGKTHVLSLLFHNLKANSKVAFIDLVSLEEDTYLVETVSRESNILIIDNYDDTRVSQLRALIQHVHPAAVICAGSTPCNLPGAAIFPIPRLTSGNRLDLGPAIKLIAHHQFASTSNDLESDILSDLKLYHELTRLTGGLPGALINSTKLIKSMGLKAATEFIKSDLSALTSFRTTSTAFSLRADILSRLEKLNESQLNGCRILARIGAPVPAELLIEAANLSPDILQDLNHLGLIEFESHGLCTLSNPIQEVLIASAIGTIDPNDWNSFTQGALLWLRRKSESESPNLEIAESFKSLSVICDWFLQSSSPNSGIELFCLMARWFGSSDIPMTLPLQVEALLISQSTLDSSKWAAAVRAIGSAYFHCGVYQRMLRLLSWAKNSSQFNQLTQSDQFKILNQTGLAYRCVEDFRSARLYYQQALDLAVENEAKVTLNYNLGCLNEADGDEIRALRYYEFASISYTENTDSRLVVQNTLSILRLRLKHEPNTPGTTELIEELFRENRLTHDRLSQSILLLDVGEVKSASGRYAEGCYYMILGLFMCLQLGYTKDTVSRCVPTLDKLIESLRELHRENLADKVEVVRNGMLVNEKNDIEDLESPSRNMLPKVLREVLLQCLQQGLLDDSSLPKELDSIVRDCDALQAGSFDYIPIVPFIEAIRIRVKLESQSPQETKLKTTPSTRDNIESQESTPEAIS